MNRSFIEAISSTLHAAELPEEYLPLARQDSFYKYNLRRNKSTENIPLNQYLGADHTAKRLFAFGKIGEVLRHSQRNMKLEKRGDWSRYFHPVNHKTNHDHKVYWKFSGGKGKGLQTLCKRKIFEFHITGVFQAQHFSQQSSQGAQTSPGPNFNQPSNFLS